MAPNTIAIIQVRLSCTRLPGKAMLSIGEYPVILLGIKRVSRADMPVTVAISTEESDDPLALLLESNGVSFIRGPLENVLERFVLATKDCDGETVVVRLTGDNVFPDSAFVEAVAKQFHDSGADYLTTLSADSPLPYGLTAEAFRVRALRDAYAHTRDPFDLEHVTPYIRRNSTVTTFQAPDKLPQSYGHLRATLDTFQDYHRLCRVFQGVGDPVAVSWQELCRILAALPEAPKFALPSVIKQNRPVSRLSLGTVQLGMSYGIANETGQPDPDETHRILSTAIRHGVTFYDTAQAYGTSEKHLGRFIPKLRTGRETIVTKCSVLSDMPEDAAPESVNAFVRSSIFESCYHLKLVTLPYLLLHRWSHYHQYGGQIWQSLLRLRDEGLVERLGASISTPEEGLAALDEPGISLIQLPFNVLDWRWRESGFVDRLAERPDVIIQARSILLQGILASPESPWPENGRADQGRIAQALDGWLAAWGREDWIDVCIAYARAQSWIDTMVIGMETEQQLQHNLRLFMNAPLTAAQCAEVEAEFHGSRRAGETLLDPALWSQRTAHELSR